MLECTQRSFLPPHWRDKVSQPEGRSRLKNGWWPFGSCRTVKGHSLMAAHQSTWFDEEANVPIIAARAQQLRHSLRRSLTAWSSRRSRSQETRLVQLMKEVEPLLSPELHARSRVAL